MASSVRSRAVYEQSHVLGAVRAARHPGIIFSVVVFGARRLSGPDFGNLSSPVQVALVWLYIRQFSAILPEAFFLRSITIVVLGFLLYPGDFGCSP